MGIDIISLIIFVACIALFVWDKLPMATTAILGCVTMVIFGVCQFKDAFGPFASSTVVLTIGVMVIGAAISETGLAATIGAAIVRISKGSETKLIIGTYLASTVMSAFLTNSAVLAIFIPIILGLSASNASLKAKNLIMPIAFGCVIGGASTLVGSTQQMTAQGLLEEAGAQTFKTFSFTPVVSIIAILGLLYCLFIGRRRGEKIWGSRTDDEVDYTVNNNEETYSKPKMIIVGAIFAATVVLYITEWLPLAVTSTAAALLCIITGCITQKKAISAVNWNIVGRLAGCLGIAKALEISGGTDLIAEGFKSIIGTNLSPFVLFCIIVFLAQFTSEFISNSTALLVVLPIVLAIAPDFGLNPYTFAMGATIAAGVPLSCPLASSTLGMSMCVGYRFNDYFKYAFPFEIISYILIIATVPAIYGLTI